MKYRDTPQDLLTRMSPVEMAAAIHAFICAKGFLRTVLSAHSLQHSRHLLQTHMRDTVMHASHEQPTQQLGRTNRRAFEQKRHRSGPGNRAFLAGWPRIGRIVRDEASLPRMLYKKKSTHVVWSEVGIWS